MSINSININEGDVTITWRLKANSHKSLKGVILNVLRAKYSDEFVKYININKSCKYKVVVILAYALEKYEDIKEQVIETLCRRLKRTKDEKRRQIIIKHLTSLSPTEGAAAAGLEGAITL
ncbi:hypothetical protein [Vulcanisaeta sp. JCM 14467]|uniref:hypothetical protein n=1 Tax=Vulcanisaeta sp. JCM 14467 TaxID=1295370 RepID=UPI0006D0B213|nr:hypothetical protein [Vulcanisaeta sp. JCM 14467]